jgi:hypothetical protein
LRAVEQLFIDAVESRRDPTTATGILDAD